MNFQINDDAFIAFQTLLPQVIESYILFYGEIIIDWKCEYGYLSTYLTKIIKVIVIITAFYDVNNMKVTISDYLIR